MNTLWRNAARRARHGVLLMVLMVLAGCQETLYSGLSESEANQMRQALLRQGIDSDKRTGDDGKLQLTVARDDIGRALRELERAGLPRHKFTSTLDVLKSDALVASPAEDRARLAYALSQELSATISGIDGVVSARVHLVMPDKPAFGALRNLTPPSASVLVKFRPGHNLQAVTLAIRQLVARSVEGLNPEHVSVVLLPSSSAEAAEAAPMPPVAGMATGAGAALSPRWLLAAAALGGVLGALAMWLALCSRGATPFVPTWLSRLGKT